MGTGFDAFDPRANFLCHGLPPHVPATRVVRLLTACQVMEYRQLLRTTMSNAGFQVCSLSLPHCIDVLFQPDEQEWWHFHLREEPYPNTHFDFIAE
jgi:D-alanyl-D-alanine dipeptidase